MFSYKYLDTMNLQVEWLSLHLIRKVYLYMIIWINEPRIRNDWLMSKIPFCIFPLILRWSTLVQKDCLAVDRNDYTWIKWSELLLNWRVYVEINQQSFLLISCQQYLQVTVLTLEVV